MGVGRRLGRDGGEKRWRGEAQVKDSDGTNWDECRKSRVRESG